MFNGFCHFGNWQSFANFGVWGWIGLILNLVFWVGLIIGLILLVVLAIRRAQVPATPDLPATGQPTAKEILQAEYANGKIHRDQYLQMLDDIS